jgi:thiol-disulfide isomerase/thioredoxin
VLADYRGKVVVLDFWYRGCGWCIRAMPQIKQIATTFEDQPVAVLGMNTDRDEEDARFVIDRLGLNYPSLKGEGLPEKFGVRGFPTLLVIDPQGIVQDVHIGYSPDLTEKVGQSIRKLLK